MTERATFSLGCFWHPDIYFSKIPGVIRTTVGYAGGMKENPTYENLGDHTETVEIIFDPAKISYQELLEHFWNQHDPMILQKTQYKSIIFNHDKGQQEHAETSLLKQQQSTHKKIFTEIKPATIFYKAEEYHQKYLEKYGT